MLSSLSTKKITTLIKSTRSFMVSKTNSHVPKMGKRIRICNPSKWQRQKEREREREREKQRTRKLKGF